VNITLELVRDTWRACYSANRLAALYDRPHTPLEVLTRKDGAWSDVPDKDRVWTVVRTLSHKQQVTFACWCARQVLKNNNDPRVLAAIEAAEGFVAGTHTIEQCRAAYAAAGAAAYAAARAADAAADAAAYATAYAVAYAAADAAAYATAYAVADAAADAAARAADATAYATAYADQVAYLVDMVKGGAK
jgi:hypothetical protein